MTAQKSRASTQKFTEIQDIFDNIVILQNGNACLIIGVQATNFSLLSREEQMVKISSYASLLNSLSFSIQILIRNKKVDITSYVKLLDGEIQRVSSIANPTNSEEINQRNEKLTNYIKLYRDFVQEMIKVNAVLNKSFYIVINYSYLEKGVSINQKSDFNSIAKSTLNTKAETLITQLDRLSLKAKILEKEDLVKLFYDIYNPDTGEGYEIEDIAQATVVRGG